MTSGGAFVEDGGTTATGGAVATGGAAKSGGAGGSGTGGIGGRADGTGGSGGSAEIGGAVSTGGVAGSATGGSVFRAGGSGSGGTGGASTGGITATGGTKTGATTGSSGGTTTATGGTVGPVKLACVGDSITQGWNGNPSYAPTLQKLLGNNFSVLNEGHSGATVLKNGDVPYWAQSVYTKTLGANADVITIMLGTNDTKSKNWDSHGGEFKSDYVALIDALKLANKNAKVMPVLPVPVCKDNYGIRASILKLVISTIKEIASEKGLTTIDANTPLLSSCSNFPDGVHPNAAGADTIAKVIADSLSK
jgi:lysophospholipase L1-like esterase